MWCVLFVLSLIVCSSLAGNEEHLSEQFCRQFPSLHLCRLHDTLQGSLVELQYLLQDTNAEGAVPLNQMEKRKSAFVRFGKRSADDTMGYVVSGCPRILLLLDIVVAVCEVDKRKSAFVRFGRSASSMEMPDKRKSQYIRFGRK